MDAAVIWDGLSDHDYRMKRMRYLAGDPDKAPLFTGKRAGRAPDCLSFCLASILKYAFFIRKVFIITPVSDIWPLRDIMQLFPDSDVKMVPVSHESLFGAYADSLPVFNRHTIGMMTPTLPGIADQYILMGSDTVFTSPCTYRDFIQGGRPVIYGCRKRKVPPAILRKYLQGNDIPSIVAVNSARLAGCSYYCSPSKAPAVISKPACLELLERHDGLLRRCAARRFESAEDVSIPGIYGAAALKEGAILRSGSETMVIKAYEDDKLLRSLRTLNEVPEIKFCKMPDLASLPFYTRHAVVDWISGRLGLRI